jgi:hypothetical protein
MRGAVRGREAPGSRAILAGALLLAAAPAAGALPLATTANDFRAPGTQPLTLTHDVASVESCANCHADYGAPEVEPVRNWSASMMGQTARDPVTWAAIAIANQDAEHAGETCLRCHLPKGWLEGRSAAADGSLMTAADREGVQCSVCHRLVDPFGRPGAPLEDAGVLASLGAPVPGPGNAMMVVDPEDRRRGPFDVLGELGADPHAPDAPTLVSPFHRSADLCGTCHNLRNPLFTRNATTGAYELNAHDEPGDPLLGFPEQATFDEWAASLYASEGVYAPQFGGHHEVVSTCQDCHMPHVRGRDASTGPVRDDLPLHELTGGNTFVPAILPHHPLFGPEVDPALMALAVERATGMLRRAASLRLTLEEGRLTVRVTNETGHKLPTGYPEGRRMWLHVRAYDASRRVVFESGRYELETATLAGYGAEPSELGHDPHLRVWETRHGIDSELAKQLGLPAGKSFHLVLNNAILADNRIPPRGFTNAAFAAFGGEPVGASFADGQHWDDAVYPVGPRAVSADAALYYQTASREYIEFLRDENTTTGAGAILYDLWEQHGRSEPVAMARGRVEGSGRGAERCRRAVAKAQKRYARAWLREWEACFEVESEGRTCDAAARDALLAEAAEKLRDSLSGAGDRSCAGADLSPSSLGHGTSCPAPCAEVTLFDIADLADCTLCLGEALGGAALEGAYGAAPPSLPKTAPQSAASCRAELAKAASGLAADLASALARCEKRNAAGKRPTADCAQDPALTAASDAAARRLARCESFAGLEGCAEAGDVQGALACLEDLLDEPAAGYVGAFYP